MKSRAKERLKSQLLRLRMRTVAMKNRFKYSSNFFTDRSNTILLWFVFMISVYCVYLLVCSSPLYLLMLARWLSCGERASHLALHVCCNIFVMFCALIIFLARQMSRVMREPTWFLIRPDTNLAVQALKMA